MSRRWLGLALVAVGACGERYPPFADNQIAAGLRAGQAVSVATLAGRVQDICDARLSDPQRESHGDFCGRSDDCVYSRAATAGLIRRWLAESPQSATIPLTLQESTEGGFTTTNLWLDLPGAVHPDEWVLAVAHYDAWFCAANDNATGTATLVEAALALAPLGLDRSVRVLWVDGEEFGMVGSNRYLEAHPHDDLIMVINADMTAFVGEQGNPLTREPATVEYVIQANEPSAAAAHALADLAGRLPEPVGTKAVVYPGSGVSAAGVILGYSLSDQSPFWMAGIPALFPFPAGDIPGWYHTPRDLPDQVDADRLQRAARMWTAGLAAFATVAR
jgi:hypothetical protein